VDKEVLSRRTNDYQNWVEAYARNHNIPIQWAEMSVAPSEGAIMAGPEGARAPRVDGSEGARAGMVRSL
jgi:hypothetical protein